MGTYNKLTNKIVDKRLSGKNIKRLENVINSQTSIKWECCVCDHVWENIPNNITKSKNPSGCPKCAKVLKITNEIVDEKLEGRNIKRLEDVVKCIDNINWLCLTSGCNYIWNISPNSILNSKTGCPKCNKNAKLTNQIVDKRLIDNDRFVKRLGNFKNCHTKIEWQCLITTCNHIWKATPTNILDNNRGCPNCKLSKGNLKLGKTCKNLNLISISEHRFDDCKDKNPLPFDRYLPELNCCIEFNGEQHYSNKFWKLFGFSEEESQLKFQDRLKKDKIKETYCQSRGILLIVIPYWDLTNMVKIIKEKLKLQSSR